MEALFSLLITIKLSGKVPGNNKKKCSIFEIMYWAYRKERIILNGGEGQGGLGKGRKDIMTQTDK